MKKTILLTLLMICAIRMFSQNYIVSWGTSSYDTLSDFTSIAYDVLPSPFISNQEVDINFGFTFPFFDSPYSSVTLNGDGVGYFSNSDVYNFFLFTGEFENHLFSGLPIHSDWRYKTDTTSGLDILKVEWRNVGIADDVEGSVPTNHRINFQVWFYENGVIEIHFGEIDLSNTPFYSGTDGFIWSDGDSYGPWIGITNLDLSEVYYVTGTNTNISVVTVEDSADIFYDIPPYGQYFRFAPNEISGLRSETLLKENEFFIYPNPVDDYFTIRLKGESRISFANATLEIYSANGELVKSLLTNDVNEKIKVSELPNGIYFVRFINEKNNLITGKIIKQ